MRYLCLTRRCDWTLGELRPLVLVRSAAKPGDAAADACEVRLAGGAAVPALEAAGFAWLADLLAANVRTRSGQLELRVGLRALLPHAGLALTAVGCAAY
jgi:hypothetical protein